MAVSETGPSVFFREWPGRSESEMSLSMDFLAKICRASAVAPVRQGIGCRDEGIGKRKKTV
jgi:hypothetical protein